MLLCGELPKNAHRFWKSHLEQQFHWYLSQQVKMLGPAAPFPVIHTGTGTFLCQIFPSVKR